MKNISTKVVIIGGGVAGSALACCLADLGIESVVIERRREPADLNRGDGLQPRSQEILEKIGVLNEFRKAGAIESYGNEIYHPSLGQLLDVDLGIIKTTPFPWILNLPHPNIEKILHEHAQKSGKCTFIYGNASEAVLEGKIISQVNVKSQGGEEISISAPVVIAADGMASRFRKKLDIAAEFTVYNHQLLCFHAKKPSWISGRARTRVYMHRKGAVLFLPLPNDIVRITAIIDSKEGGDWSGISVEELKTRLSERLPQFKDLEIDEHGMHFYKLQKMHAAKYSEGNLALVGDAAHVTHPAGGQGMNMGIQDADELARQLLAYFSGEQNLEKSFDAYERVRRPINQNVISRAQFMSWLLWSPKWSPYLGRTFYAWLLRILPPVYNKVTSSIAWSIAGLTPPQ